MLSRGLISTFGRIWVAPTRKVAQIRPSQVPIRSYAAKPSGMPNWGPKTPGQGKGPVSWKTLRSSGIILVALGGMYIILKNKKDKEIAKARQRSVGKAAIGGDFELIDHTGKTVTNKDFKGHWIMLYFGFTHCPDICPDEMEKMALVKDKLVTKSQSDGAIDGQIVPLFITVDPARDGVKEVSEYIKEFHPAMIGLTGTMDAVTTAAKTFRVYFSAGPAEYENDYIVDHTIIIYLINPDGEFVDYYGQSKTAEQITQSITKHMYKYRRLHAPSILDRVTDFVFGPDEDND
ncbi:protein SCO2 homolog, mitochondrial [Lepeophtheirus salmonis]|uniref:Thioredoxin domain-containing protein n=1 Tax=Lepeophtheirus salmonis TaxID=72036 RepID=A0A0K2VH95_LEPSM|nr:protein SCO2 homolog, mitochondrial-like [Lepeophtheirus salmonis]